MSSTALPSPFFARLLARCAEVRVDARVTRYIRHGAGHPLVVLHSGEGGLDLWPGLLESLSAHARVIGPEPHVPDASFACWLGGFLDGIGVSSVTLIAAGPFCMPALELVLLDPERVDRLVLVPDGDAPETGLSGSIGGAQNRVPVPLLVVRRTCAASEAIELIGKFAAHRA